MANKDRVYISDIIELKAKLKALEAFNLANVEVIDETGEILQLDPNEVASWQEHGFGNKHFFFSEEWREAILKDDNA